MFLCVRARVCTRAEDGREETGRGGGRLCPVFGFLKPLTPSECSVRMDPPRNGLERQTSPPPPAAVCFYCTDCSLAVLPES